MAKLDGYVYKWHDSHKDQWEVVMVSDLEAEFVNERRIDDSPCCVFEGTDGCIYARLAVHGKE